MQVIDVVARSLRILRVVDAEAAPNVNQVKTAIDALNAMMARWEANGINVGWSNALTPDELLTAPDEAVEAICYNLAARMRSEFGVVMDPDVIALAADGLNLLRRDNAIAKPLVRMRTGWHYNIYTDQYQ